jgi:hypothetical protein
MTRQTLGLSLTYLAVPNSSRQRQQRGSVRGQMQELAAGKFHYEFIPPAFLDHSSARASSIGGTSKGIRETGALRNIGASLPRSVRLDVREFDHFAPFLGFVDDEFAEVGGRAWKCGDAQLGKTRLHLGIGEGRDIASLRLLPAYTGKYLVCVRPSCTSRRHR